MTNEPLMTQLIFVPSDDLRTIFEHTKNATKWTDPYGVQPEMQDTAHLDFVKDRGIYIMSGSTERLLSESDSNSSLCIYAQGYDPKVPDCWDKCREAVGGDDFVECLPIDDSIFDGIASGQGFWIDFRADSLAYGTWEPKKQPEESRWKNQ